MPEFGRVYDNWPEHSCGCELHTPNEALAGGVEGAVEGQEARGQQKLVQSQVLPADVRGSRAEEVLREWGVELGRPVEGDPMFRYAALPKGWQKRPTEHSMWSELVDAEGRVRAEIFYKAAAYDRRAFMNLVEEGDTDALG